MMFVRSVFIVLSFALAIPVVSAQELLWLRQFGSSQTDSASALEPDGAGGVFIAGTTKGNLGGSNAGSEDIWLGRFTDAGRAAWLVQFGSTRADYASAVSSDNKGGFFVGGTTSGTLSGPSQTSYDAWLARYDGSGNRRWLRQFGSTSQWDPDRLQAMAPDGIGGVYVGGITNGDLGGTVVKGVSDAWLACYDEEGSRVWVRQIGSPAQDQIWAMAGDGAGGVFVAGGFDHEAWLARYDGDGTEIWTRLFGTPGGSTVPLAMAADTLGGVFVSGNTREDFAGPNAGGEDVWIACYDSNGTQLWVDQFGTSENESVPTLTYDNAGGVIVAGSTLGSLGGPGAGFFDAFMVRYDNAGNQLWVHQFGTDQSDWANALAPDGTGGVMVAGRTDGDLGGSNRGLGDVFLARYEIDSCYADCDASTGVGVLDIFDFLCFQNSFVSGETYACDCDTSTGNGVCDVFDFLCFQNAFVGGCP